MSCSEERLVLTSPGHCPSLEALQTTANGIRWGAWEGPACQLSPTQEHLFPDSAAGAHLAFPDMPPTTRHLLPYQRVAAGMTLGFCFSPETSHHLGDW